MLTPNDESQDNEWCLVGHEESWDGDEEDYPENELSKTPNDEFYDEEVQSAIIITNHSRQPGSPNPTDNIISNDSVTPEESPKQSPKETEEEEEEEKDEVDGVVCGMDIKVGDNKVLVVTQKIAERRGVGVVVRRYTTSPSDEPPPRSTPNTNSGSNYISERLLLVTFAGEGSQAQCDVLHSLQGAGERVQEMWAVQGHPHWVVIKQYAASSAFCAPNAYNAYNTSSPYSTADELGNATLLNWGVGNSANNTLHTSNALRSESAALSVLLQLLSAVQTLHSCNAPHGAVCLSAIHTLHPAPRIVLCNHRALYATLPPSACPFASPEILASSIPSTHSDIFSIAATLFSLISNQIVPFVNNLPINHSSFSDHAGLHSALLDVFKNLSYETEDSHAKVRYSNEFIAILHNMLNHKPEERKTIDELIEWTNQHYTNLLLGVVIPDPVE